MPDNGERDSFPQDHDDWLAKARTAGLPRLSGNGHDHTQLTNRYGWEAVQAQPMGTIVRGLLHAGSVTLLYGAPKSGKSFLLTDCFLAIAAKRTEWMGHPIVRHGPVLYVACEGHAGYWKRLKAKAHVEGWKPNTFPENFILSTGRPTLIQFDPDTRAYVPHPHAVITAINEASVRGFKPIAVAVDTVFRSFGGGNVNASDHMNAYLSALSEITDANIALAAVHHETKSGNTPAGSVTLIGGVDTVARTSNTPDGHTWEIECAKDDAPSNPRFFSLTVIDIGTDFDGQPASSCVVTPGEPAPTQAKPVRLSSAAAIAMRALDIALARHGSILPPFPHFPLNTVAVGIELWRTECYSLKGGDPELNRKTFNRGQDALIAAYLVSQRDGYVWKCSGTPTGTDPGQNGT